MHLLPTASHGRLLIKHRSRDHIRHRQSWFAGSRKIAGARGRQLGFLWTFDRARLEPGRLLHACRSSRCVGRPARAVRGSCPRFPSPGDSPKSVRLLILFLRRRSLRPAGPQADRWKHAPIPDAGCQAATCPRARHAGRPRCCRRERRSHRSGRCGTERADLLGASPAAQAYAGVFNRAEVACWVRPTSRF